MRYLSVCSGIEAATVAWHGLGWTPVGFSEIEPFPSAVLAHHYPNVPNFGDMTKHEQWPLQPGSIDLLVGGTPCQSFSVAGLRKGLEDPRGNLMLTYLAIAARLRPKYLVWENVPGVLSSNGGRDFGTFLGALGELRYGFAYRVLDAQYVRVGRWPRAVPQRRRRVFVVGCLGDGTAAAEVLALEEGLRRHLEAQSKKGKNAPSDAEGGARGGCWWDGSDCAGTLTKQNAGGGQRMPDKDNLGAVLQPIGYRWQNNRDGLQQDDAVAAMRASTGSSGFHEMNHPVVVAHAFYSTDGTHGVNQHPEVSPAVKVGSGLGIPSPPAVAHTLNLNCRAAQEDGTGRGSPLVPVAPAVAHALRGEGFDASEDGTGRGTPLVPVAPSLTATNDPSRSPQSSEVTQQVAAVYANTMTVRRLTARECERLQAFPDDYTLIPWRKKPAEECPDGLRYRALGNSMACNCMAWIGERIAAYEDRHEL